MSPTDEEMKIAYIAELYCREERKQIEETVAAADTVPPLKKMKIDHGPSHSAADTAASPSGTDFQSEVRRQLASFDGRLIQLEKGQKKNEKLLERILGVLYHVNDNIEGNPLSNYAVRFRRKGSPLSLNSDDLSINPRDHDDHGHPLNFSDVETAVDEGVQAAAVFLSAAKAMEEADMKGKEEEKKNEEREETEFGEEGEENREATRGDFKISL